MRSTETDSHSWPRLVAHPRVTLGLCFMLLVCTGCASSPTTATPSETCESAAQAPNPIVVENICTGSNAWQPDHPRGPDDAIEAFTVPASVNIGETVKIFVSTTAPSFHFEVYRMGWYEGLGGRLEYSSDLLPGIRQPPPTFDRSTRMVSGASWHDPVTLKVPSTWVSGVYVVKLMSSADYMRYTLFVVRDDASSAPLLFQTSLFTYQAYNLWGGYSLYFGRNQQTHAPGAEAFTRTDRSYAVSFDRPYLDNMGLGDFPNWDINLLRWLERTGYNVTYSTDLDTDLHGDLLRHHRLLVVAGHDEYWSTPMRNHITAARDAGVSLAFFGANDGYWRVRTGPSPNGSDRIITCFREVALDPLALSASQEATVTWRAAPLNDPENALLGAMYEGSVNGNAPLLLDAGARPFLAGTHLSPGSHIPGIVGGEYDRIFDNGAQPSSLSVLASSPLQSLAGGASAANATLYTVASGAKVFDAGTFQWSWGLDNESFDPQRAHSFSTPEFQRLTANLLAYLVGN